MLKRTTLYKLMPALLLLFASSLVMGARAADKALLFVDGKLSHTFTDFQLVDETVYLPLKESAKALGIEGFADGQSRTVYFRASGKLVIVDTYNKKVAVGMKVQPIETAPIWTAREVYVPHQVFTTVLAPLMGVEIRVKAQSGSSQVDTSLATTLRDPVDVIVLDPGHGGYDTGARGPGGVFEKDVTLAISKKLRDRLMKEDGLSVYLTRDGDTFIPLQERPRKAKKLGADVFVSIHANGYKLISTEGFETFFASLEATDQAALDLAAWENKDVPKQDQPPVTVMNDLEAILGDMAQTEYLSESQRLAEMVQNEMATVMKSDNRGVKQAPFHVLMQSSMPAVLVEVGFITSPIEAKQITDADTQEKIVEALATAILAYRDQTNARLGLVPK